jgi:DNA polymerase-3 subunit delta
MPAKTDKNIKPIYVILGPDNFLVTNRCQALLDELLTPEQRPMSLYQPRLDQTGIADILDELRTLPFLAERRVVLIKDADKFVTANREILERYFDAPSPTGVLILLMKSLDKRTKIAKKLPKVGQLIDVGEIKPWHLPKYAADYAKSKHAKTMSTPTAQLLVELVGDAPGRICSEIDKLAMYAADKNTITADHVETLIGHNRMFNAFAVIDAITDSDATAALTRLRKMFASDKSTHFTAIGAFAYHFRRLFSAKEMLEKGLKENQIAPKLNVWGNRQQPFFRQVNKIPLEKLGTILSRLARIDYLIKTGQTTAPVAIEQLVLKLSTKQ